MKTVLITGASRGIGRATALLLGREGWRVVVNFYRQREAAQSVVDEIHSAGGQALAIQANLADETQIMAMFAYIDSQCGRLDALVNNAGILLTQCRVEDLSAERISQIFTLNVTAPFLCCREAVKRMGTHHGMQGGAIVNVSSVAAGLGSPGEYVDYAASKGAVDTLTYGLAQEVAAQGIRVNAVRPGVIHTDIHVDGGEPGRVERVAKSIPMQRGGQPEEIAETIGWLLSEKASYITGSLVDAAGGR